MAERNALRSAIVFRRFSQLDTECSTHTGAYEEVKQNDDGKNHLSNVAGYRASPSYQCDNVWEQAECLKDNHSPIRPALQVPQTEDKEECDHSNGYNDRTYSNAERVHKSRNYLMSMRHSCTAERISGEDKNVATNNFDYALNSHENGDDCYTYRTRPTSHHRVFRPVFHPIFHPVFHSDIPFVRIKKTNNKGRVTPACMVHLNE